MRSPRPAVPGHDGTVDGGPSVPRTATGGPPGLERRQVTMPDGRRLTFYPLSEPADAGAPAPAVPAPGPPPREEG